MAISNIYEITDVADDIIIMRTVENRVVLQVPYNDDEGNFGGEHVFEYTPEQARQIAAKVMELAGEADSYPDTPDEED